ncbi:MAG TPA: hypothetical protein VK459_18955 [Polyangiaceae bacterium]|nr:hypothetical protein [Polyangiaceae bacterium]
MAWQFLPPFIDLEAAILSLGLPRSTPLRKVGVADVVTSDKTDITVLKLTLGKGGFQVDFTPSLVIKLPPPLVDMGLGGVHYDFQTGAMTPRVWHESEVGIPVGKDSAIDGARGFMRGLVTGTPLAIPPYDPSADQDLILTVQQILQNLDGGGSSGGSIVLSISLSARLVILKEIAAELESGGFRIPAGATIKIDVDLAGAPADVKASPRIKRAEVDCSSLVLRQGGADLVELGRVLLLPGGVLEVNEVRPLGAVGKVAAVESLVRLFGELDRGGSINAEPLQPRVVEGLVKKELEDAIRPALLQWVRDNAAIASGMDLRDVLSVPA